MTLTEAQTKLAAVQEQIDKIVAAGGVDSYGIEGRTVHRSLEFLERERARLEQIVAGLSGGQFIATRLRNIN